MQLSSLSSELLRSGMPAVLCMSFGQMMARGYNRWQKYTPDEPGYVDALTGSRIVVAFVSSAVAPAVFAGVLSFMGFWPALLGALLLAFDPHHVALSRMAIPDGILTLLIVATVLNYIASVYSPRYRLKILCGFYWGLSIAINPMSLGLVVVFAVYKLGRLLVNLCSGEAGKNDQEKEEQEDSGDGKNAEDDEGILDQQAPGAPWGDLWVIIAAHLTFVILDRQLWTPGSDYRTRGGWADNIGRSVYRSGAWLGEQQTLFWIVAAVALAGCVAGFFLSRKSKKQGFLSHGAMLLGLISTILLALMFFPQVLQNLIYFWNWTIVHREELYGRHYGGGDFLGPFTFLVFRTPSIVLLGLLAALWAAFLGSFSRRDQPEEKQATMPVSSAFLFFLSAIALWAFPLGSMSKQAIRYLLPVIPLIYLFTAWGFRVLTVRILRDKVPQSEMRLAQQVLGGSLVFLQAVILYSWSPHYHLFFNAFTGGLGGAHGRGQLQFVGGENKVLTSLHNRAVSDAQETLREKRVAVLGDVEMLKQAYERTIQNKSSWLRFERRFVPIRSDLLAVLGSFTHPDHLYREHPWLKGRTPAFDYRFRGVQIIAVYEVPLPSYQSSHLFEAGTWSQGTGIVRPYEGTEPVRATSARGTGSRMVLAEPGVHPKGALMYDVIARVPEGKYIARFMLGVPRDKPVNARLLPDDYAVRLSLTDKCSRIVALKELSNKELRPIEVECVFLKPDQIRFGIHWYGYMPVIVYQVELMRDAG